MVRIFTLSILVFVAFTTFTFCGERKRTELTRARFSEISVGKIGKNALVDASLNSGLVFCYERAADGVPLEKHDLSRLSGKSLSAFIQEIEKIGFECTVYENAILIVDPKAKTIDENPLDKQVPGFLFQGNHDDFLKKLGGFNSVTTNNIMGNISYTINIKQPITIRKLLMYIASHYGISWNATITAEAPVIFRKGPEWDSDVTGSKVTLSFQPLRKRPHSLNNNEINSEERNDIENKNDNLQKHESTLQIEPLD